MRKLGLVLLVLLLAGFAAGCISTSSGGTGSTSTTSAGAHSNYVVVNGTRIYLDEIHFYMYGLKTCPHCRHMHEWIPQEYGNSSLTYYELLNNETNDRLFEEISRLTGITGVPAIAITYNGTLMAIIEGEFNVTATPQIIHAAMTNNGTLLFVGGKGYIMPHNDPKAQRALKELYDLFVKHEMPVNATSGG
ncbi:glutaredoxin [Thermococcus sp.]|uniref:glutaredoxin n=1 Tax=Thermococcus sp. TaxID=35749 RepID=UPI0026296BE5|nr:glutaredoxin [Thermococcus sp.]